MPRRISAEEHIEGYFTRESQPKCIAQRERIDLMMRVRFPELQDPKRGRPKRKKREPSLDLKGGAVQGSDGKSARPPSPRKGLHEQMTPASQPGDWGQEKP